MLARTWFAACDGPGCLVFQAINGSTFKRDVVAGLRERGWWVSGDLRTVRCPIHVPEGE